MSRRRITTAELGRAAPRPAYSVLRSENGDAAAPALARRPARLPRAARRLTRGTSVSVNGPDATGAAPRRSAAARSLVSPVESACGARARNRRRPGSSAPTSSAPRRRGRRGRRPRQAHLRRQPREPRRRRASSSDARRHRRRGRGRGRGRGLRRDRQLRRRDARRPLDPRAGGVHPHRRPRDAGAPRARPRRTGTRLVHVSTDEVYGDIDAGGSAGARTTRCAPRARTRRRRPEATCRCSPTSAPTASTRSITRGANTYGPYQYPEKLIPLFVTNALDGEPLPVYGDGRQRREWLHVDDHCAAIELVLREGAAGRVYNVGGGRSSRTSTSCGAILDLRAPPEARPPRRATGPGTTGATRSTRRSSRASAGARARVRGRASPRRSSGTAPTAAGGSRSSPASTSRTTGGSTRAARAAIRGDFTRLSDCLRRTSISERFALDPLRVVEQLLERRRSSPSANRVYARL